MSNDGFLKARKFATMVLLLTSAAELVLKDYEFELRKLGYESKQAAKMRVNNNARLAEQLAKSLRSLEAELNAKITPEMRDNFLDDVGFVYSVVNTSLQKVGDDNQRREMLLKMISKLKTVDV